mmetsp:Transcript_21891/g.33415  ORF Transcript_21891/g.33415 Transcript_21891/m.33415 type:complete len:423 (+) Transcript_21891:712-1980(+)
MESTPHQESEGRALCQVLAMVLERLVEASSNFEQDDSQVTKFHALRAPAIGICQYLERINKYASCSSECFVLALIYIDRLIQRNNFVLTELNVHRVVITAVLLAAKFFDDAYYNNAYYAKVGGVLVSEMNSLEVEFLFRINFSLRVVPEVFQKYHAELVSHASSMGLRIEPCSTDPSVLGIMAPQPKVQSSQHHRHGNVYPTSEIPQVMLSLDCPVDSAVQHNVPVVPPTAVYQQSTANHYNNGSITSHQHQLNPSQITPSPPQWKPVNGSEAGWKDSNGTMYHHILSQHLPGSTELAIELQQQLLLSHASKGQGATPAQQYGNMPPFPQLPVTTTPFSTACSPAYYAQVPENLNQPKPCYTSQQPHSNTMMHKNCADLIANDVGLTWQQPPDVTTSYSGHHYFVASPTSEFPINNSPQIRS